MPSRAGLPLAGATLTIDGTEVAVGTPEIHEEARSTLHGTKS